MKIQNIPLNDIKQSENSRMKSYNEDLHELMSSLRSSGLLQPIGISPDSKQPGSYRIIYGNRRYLAAKRLGWTSIPAMVLDEIENEDDFLVKNLTENIQRRQLSFPEEGRYFQELKKKGLTFDEIAVRVGITKRHVDEAVKAFNVVPAEFRKSIKTGVPGKQIEGTIPSGIAMQIINNSRSMNQPEIHELFQRVKDGILNAKRVAQVTRLVRGGMSVKRAIKEAEQMRSIGIHVTLKIAVIDKLEKKYKKSIHNILMDSLKDVPEFDIEQDYSSDEEESDQLDFGDQNTEHPARKKKVILRKADQKAS